MPTQTMDEVESSYSGKRPTQTMDEVESSYSGKRFEMTDYIKILWRYEERKRMEDEATQKKYMDEFMNEIEKTRAEAKTMEPQAGASDETMETQAGASDDIVEPQAGSNEELIDKLNLEKISASDLSLAVVSVTLFNGKEMVYACSGVAVRHWHGNIQDGHRIIVTSACLANKFDDNRTRDDNLRIEVRTEGNVIMHGFLGLHDGNIAMVTTLSPHLLYTVDTSSPVNLPEGTRSNKLLAVGLATDGSLMGASCSDPVIKDNKDGLLLVNCNIKETGLGGPVIYFGRGGSDCLVGIITDCHEGKTTILPTKMLHEWLQRVLLITSKTSHFHGFSLPPGVKTVIPSGFAVTSKIHQSLGYPLPPPLVFEFNGRLIGMFEELFGQYDCWEGYSFQLPYHGEKRIWKQFGEAVAKKISQSVVSIASFCGAIRNFACTGLLIEGKDKGCKLILTSASLVRNAEGQIDTNMSIEVFLPPDQSADGILEMYHENYNIAIVSLSSELTSVSPQDIFARVSRPSKSVVAIGRAPKIADGLLMASMGEVMGKHNAVTKLKNKHLTCPHHGLNLDCEDLLLSTCQIKKVGIGGPLMSLDGKFIGMNFYDESRTTPFLPKIEILKVLYKWFAIERDSVSRPVNMEDYMEDHLITRKRQRNLIAKRQRNQWPVSKPYWCLSGQVDVLDQISAKVLKETSGCC